MDKGPWFSVKQVAGKLGLHPDTVRDYCNAGDITCIRVGKRRDRRVSWQAIEAYVASLADDEDSDEQHAVCA